LSLKNNRAETEARILDRVDTFRDPEGELAIKALTDLERDHILQVLKKTG